MDKKKRPKAPTTMEASGKELLRENQSKSSDAVKKTSAPNTKTPNDESENANLRFSSSGSTSNSGSSGSESNARVATSRDQKKPFPEPSDASDSESSSKAGSLVASSEAKSGKPKKKTSSPPAKKSTTAGTNTKSADTVNKGQSTVEIKILDLEKWHITYVRTRNNSLRCFPACRPKHRDRSFCGLPVLLSVSIDTESAAKELVVLGSFRKVKNDAIQLGDRFSTVELTRVLGKDFVIATFTSYDKKTKSAKFKLGPPRKWRYSANTLSSTEMHAFTIYVFSKAGGCCVARKDSPLFTIVPAWRQSASEITARAQASSDEAKSGSELPKSEYPTRDRRMPPGHGAMYGGHEGVPPYPMYGGHQFPWPGSSDGPPGLRKRPRMSLGQPSHPFPMPRAPPYYDPRQMEHGRYNPPRPRLSNAYSKDGSSSTGLSRDGNPEDMRYDWGAERGMPPPHYNHFHAWNSQHYVPPYPPPFYPYSGFPEQPRLDRPHDAYLREAPPSAGASSRTASTSSETKQRSQKRDAGGNSMQQFMHQQPYYPPPGAYQGEMPFDRERYEARFRNGNR